MRRVILKKNGNSFAKLPRVLTVYVSKRATFPAVGEPIAIDGLPGFDFTKAKVESIDLNASTYTVSLW